MSYAYLVRNILPRRLLKHVSRLVGDLLVGAALLGWVDFACDGAVLVVVVG